MAVLDRLLRRPVVSLHGFGVGFRAYLDPGDHLHHLGFHAVEHLGEHLERLALELLLRILLGVAPQADALAQVIHRRQVLLPVVVEHLQHHGLLETAHRARAREFFLGLMVRLEALHDALAQRFLVQILFLFEPLAQRQIQSVLAAQRLFQSLDVPLLLERARRDILADQVADDVVTNRAHGFADIVRRQQFVALLVDLRALIVGDVVVLQQLLTHVEVVALDLALGVLDRARHPVVLDRLAFLHTQALHQRRYALGGEDPHQRVFQREIKPAGTGVALAARTAAELIVDSPRFMALGADDMQPPRLDDRVMPLLPVGSHTLALFLGGIVAECGEFAVEVAAEHDVGTPAGHVGRDRHFSGPTGVRDDFGLALVLLCVQHVMRDVAIFQCRREAL